MINILLIAVILCIAGGAVLYLYKAKKRGETCIGCPYAKQCARQHNGSCGCHGNAENRKKTSSES